ncbi:MAG TPA: hypothetical protein VNG04_01390 [Candidatus Acidoferrum sp.]|nr:hypothetical protein [Candidatus Acidoferrum sp.]
MRCLLSLTIAIAFALQPAQVAASSSWGSSQYGDPPSWCIKFSDMWTATVITNDPQVGTNPEQDTFYGFHPNPGYDDWYGFFYGDFRGTPGDSSGWVRLLHENYPHHYHWNFASNGWAVHGHVKQYIAYYNWTFGGQCGLGAYGNNAAPPYMADQYGYPVVDIYVDSVPPFNPTPYVTGVTPSSVSFTWDPVADRGDGAGRDYFAAGLDHYVSWLTVGDAPSRLEVAATSAPRTVSLAGMTPGETACLHVQAVDRVQNSTADQVACATPLTTPPMPVWGPVHSVVMANPNKVGLVGLDTWFWLAPTPAALTADETYMGSRYVVTATPISASWDFGDGSTAAFTDGSGFGRAYPQASSVTHTYQAHSRKGYAARAVIGYDVTWVALAGGRTFGPYPLGAMVLPADALIYPVEQAQPELIAT